MKTIEEDAAFAEALESCCRRVSEGVPLERCLEDYPAPYRAELARLVPVANLIQRVGSDPSQPFANRLEERLLGSLARHRRAQKPGLLARIGRRLSATPALRVAVVAAVVLMAVAAGAMTAVQASEGSLPDSPLYQVKMGREWLEVALARETNSQVDVRSRQIAQRGRELERAVRAGRGPGVVDVVALRLAWATEAMVDRALEAQATGNRQPARRARVALVVIQRHVDRLTPQAAESARPALERLQRFLDQQLQRLPAR